MTALTEREKALEEKYVLDFERALKVRERSDRLPAEWAAQTIGRTDKAAYADEVVAAGQAKAGDDDVLLKILRDFNAANLPVSIARTLDEANGTGRDRAAYREPLRTQPGLLRRCDRSKKGPRRLLPARFPVVLEQSKSGCPDRLSPIQYPSDSRNAPREFRRR